MKQVILRVSDDLHRRLAARAAREGTSMNAWTSRMLDAAVDADVGDRQARLEAKATELGLYVPIDAEPVDEETYWAAIESMRGIGPVLDDILRDFRGP